MMRDKLKEKSFFLNKMGKANIVMINIVKKTIK